jgi:integrase
MNKNEEILENYTRRLSCTGALRAQYIRYAVEFLDYAGGEITREKVLSYVEKQRRKGQSDGTVNFKFRQIRTIFSRNNMEWPFNRGEAPQIRENKVNAPALDPEVIIEMIEAVKKKGQVDERFFLALSSTYGVRRTELRNLIPGDILLKDRVLHIATAKHGRDRNHMIPEQIVPYLEAYEFSETTVSDFYLLGVWYRLENMVGMEHTNRVGFHAVRRTIDTMLLRSLPDATVSSFMRWKQRTSSSMSFRYSAQTFVGKGGPTTKVTGESLETDKLVFEVHPFIKYWE